MKNIYIAVVGLGTVGSSVVKILQDNKDIISARTGVNLIPKIGIAKNLDSKKDLNIKLSSNIADALDDDSIDIVVELIGGVDLPFEIAQKALRNGKSFITANKAMLAYHRYDLENLAQSLDNKHSIGFEASVCGGIPIIRALRDGLCANHILSLKGILNGTSNFILTKMTNDSLDFDTALQMAKDLGYAEADPSLDISGLDSAHKLLILCSLAYGINVKVEDIIIEGIEGIEKEDILFAKEFGYEIKLLGLAKQTEDFIEIRVHLCLTNKHSMIAKVEGAMNAVSVFGDMVGESFYYGAGAGGSETASSVVSDIIEIARSTTPFPMLGYRKDFAHNLKLRNKNDLQSKYYLRLAVFDKLGVLGLIANIFNEFNISIKSLLQKDSKDINNQKTALLLLSTHLCKESDFQNALNRLRSLSEVIKEPFMIRIDE